MAMDKEIAPIFGRLFEIGFNLGFLTYIQQNQLKHHFGNIYYQDLSRISLIQIHKQIKSSLKLNQQNKVIVEKWSLFLLQKGFLSGLNFLREYLTSIINPELNADDSSIRNKQQQQIEILYFQCNFNSQNSFNLIQKDDEEYHWQILSQLNNSKSNREREEINFDWQGYQAGGEFLQADNLMLLKYRHREYRLLVIDLSIFGVKSITDLKDLDEVSNQKQLLLKEVSYFRSKSVFSRLNIDTGIEDNNLDVDFANNLADYLHAFQREDKETYKLFQAGSYAYSFYQFLTKHPIIPSIDNLKINIIGYTDRSLNSIAVTPKNLDLLKTCYHLYHEKPKEFDRSLAQKKVINTIKSNVSRSFVNGRQFINSIFNLASQYSDDSLESQHLSDNDSHNDGDNDRDNYGNDKQTPESELITKLVNQNLVNQQIDISFDGIGIEDKKDKDVIEDKKVNNHNHNHHHHQQTVKENHNQNHQTNINNISTSPENIYSSSSTIHLSHQETIDNFVNSISHVTPELKQQFNLDDNFTLRDAHAQLITLNLNDSNLTYLFLTGNPGIGKTTAIVNFLKQNSQDGFLFLYISPRTQVNLDIMEKFKGIQTTDFLAINTNANLIKSNQGRKTIQYFSDYRQGDFRLKTIEFLDGNHQTHRQVKTRQQLRQTNEDTYNPQNNQGAGVLSTLCEAIANLIEEKSTRHLVATLSIQSLKQLTSTADTSKYFDIIFQSAYNKRNEQVMFNKLVEISRQFRHFFIMIDEITGDNSGVAFFQNIKKLVNKFHLHNHKSGFNTKVIIADASIVDRNVIKQHLNTSIAEPDKIYYRRAENQAQSLTEEEFYLSRNLPPGKIVNTNSYPAKSLTINYHLFIALTKYQENNSKFQPQIKTLIKQANSQIIRDINTIWQEDKNAQIIIYIQDKPRLQELINYLKETLPETEEFKPYEDYLEIHANNSEFEKNKIKDSKDKVKIIFMTASGSRGLSFPKTRYILVDVPRFNIEQNLMEIIQVIYRGRGDDKIDNLPKYLTFYLAEEITYYSENKQISIQENLLNLVNILLILKTAIMTRIYGYGKIGKNNYVMIPIGGKSLSSAGETFSGKMANLIRELRKESKRRYDDKLLENTYLELRDLLSQGNFLLTSNPTYQSNNQTISYLDERESFSYKFCQLANTNLGELLNFKPIENSYFIGSVLIVPFLEKSLQETYLLQLKEKLTKTLLAKLYQIKKSSYKYPNNLIVETYGGIELIEKMLDNSEQYYQKLEQHSYRFDQYYALPFYNFLSPDIIKEYLQNQQEKDQKYKFRDILSSHLRYHFPLNGILPIGEDYLEFPFLIFNSYSLRVLRSKLFSDKRLLASHELNILNLILCD